jgi:REP element-mobilizing transposase RayT
MGEARYYRRRLPHWRVDGAIYFVTWRVAKGGGDLNPAERAIVAEALRFAGRRHRLWAFVVMNDHVHVLVQPRDVGLEALVRSWKGFTGSRLRQHGRLAPVWQREYFDRIVRNQAELDQKLRYIAENPSRRFRTDAPYPWLWIAQ